MGWGGGGLGVVGSRGGWVGGQWRSRGWCDPGVVGSRGWVGRSGGVQG